MNASKYKLIMEKDKAIKSVKCDNSLSTYQFVKEKLKLDKEPEEVAYLLCLDNKLCLTGYFEVSRGCINRSVLHPREVFKRAIVSNASNIILVHNHPSGDCTPSSDDKFVTSVMRDTGQMVGISLLDHIIIGEKGYYSFQEESPNRIDIGEVKRRKKEMKKENSNNERSM